MRAVRIVLAAMALWALATACAGAATFTTLGTTAPSGLYRAADGSVWVLGEFDHTITHLSATGATLKTLHVPSDNAQLNAITAGADGKLYVGSQKGLFKVDPATADGTTLTPTYVTPPASTGCAGDVGAVVPVDSNHLAFTGTGHTDNAHVFQDCHSLDLYKISTAQRVNSTTLPSDAYHLAFANGKIFTANFTDSSIERLSVFNESFTPEAVFEATDLLEDVALFGPSVYAPLYEGQKVARFDASGPSSSNPTLLQPPAGFTMHTAVRIFAALDGNLYISDADEEATTPKGALVRMSPDGSRWNRYPLPGGGSAFDIAQGPVDDQLYVSDRDHRLLLFTNGKPVVQTGTATASADGHAVLRATVDPRGNATNVRFQFGKTIAYGSLSGPQSATGVGPRPVTVSVTGLDPSATYHYRAVAKNSEGPATGADAHFTTPAAPRLAAKLSFKAAKKGRRWVVKRLKLTGVAAGEKVTLSCAGGKAKGCPFKKKTRTVKSGTTLDLVKLLKGHKLRGGAKLRIAVTKPGAVGKLFEIRFRSGKKPKRQTQCLPPGSSKPVAC